MKVDAQLIDKDVYVLPDQRVIRRDFTGKTQNGNPLAGRWTLRDAAGTLLDFDQYINDLSERHQINLYSDANLEFSVGEVNSTKERS